MRRRLQAATFGIALAAVLVLGVPLGVVASRLVHRDAQSRLDNESQRVARAIDSELEAGRLPTPGRLAELVPAGHGVVVTDAQGRRVRSVAHPEPALRATAPAADGARVDVSAPTSEANERARGIWLAIALLAGAGLVAALALGWFESRRLAAPLEELAAAAARLGTGDFSARSGAHPLPEVEALATALERSAERLAESMTRERAFSANVSHQLRTPLTALRLRLEEIEQASSDPGLQAEAEAALAQADRLDRTVDSLLDLARRGRAGDARALDAAAVARERVAAWGGVFAHEHRGLDVDAPRPASVRASPGALEQVLDVLLENALAHGTGTTRLVVRAGERHVALRVIDDGTRLAGQGPDEIFERSAARHPASGLGLVLARGLIEADGGRLRLAQAQPTTFEVLLPSLDS